MTRSDTGTLLSVAVEKADQDTPSGLPEAVPRLSLPHGCCTKSPTEVPIPQPWWEAPGGTSDPATAAERPALRLARADETALRRALDAYFDAATSGDASRWAALYANEAVIMPPNSATVEGRGAIETWLKALPVVTTDADGDTLEVDGTSHLACVRSTYKMSMTMPSVAQPVRQVGKFLQIYARQPDGAWLLARDIWNANASPPSR